MNDYLAQHIAYNYHGDLLKDAAQWRLIHPLPTADRPTRPGTSPALLERLFRRRASILSRRRA